MKAAFLALIVGFITSGYAFADQVFSQNDLDRLAAQYFASETSGPDLLSKPSAQRSFSIFKQSVPSSENFVRCEEDEDFQRGGPSCTDAVCSRIGQHNCDELSEIEAVGRVCRGHFNGTCVAKVCSRIGEHNCNELSEIEAVTNSCRGSSGSRCQDKVCSMIGEHNCNELSEISTVNRVCQGLRTSCLESVCQRIGSHNCNELSEIEKVGRSCRGN